MALLFAFGIVLFGLVALAAMAVVFASAEYVGPEEPWLDWDGEIPAELDSRPLQYSKALCQKVVYPKGWVHGVNWDARPQEDHDA